MKSFFRALFVLVSCFCGSQGIAETPHRNRYSFSLLQKISENASPLAANRATQFQEFEVAISGTVLLVCAGGEAYATVIYNEAVAGKKAAADTVCVRLTEQNGELVFYAEKNTNQKKLLLLKKLFSFVRHYHEAGLLTDNEARVEKYYDGIYSATYLPVLLSDSLNVYQKALEKFKNNDLLRTRVLIDSSFHRIIYKKTHLSQVSVFERKRQKFGTTLISETETVFLLTEVPGDLSPKEPEVIKLREPDAHVLFSEHTIQERKKGLLGACVNRNSPTDIKQLMLAYAADKTPNERKYICMTAAVYHYFPDSVKVLEEYFRADTSPRTRSLIVRGAAESLAPKAHSFLAGVLATQENTALVPEVLIHLTALGYTESAALTEELMRTVRAGKAYSRSAALSLAAISGGIRERDPALSAETNTALYKQFGESAKTLSDSLFYLDLLSNNDDEQRSFFIAILINNEDALPGCVSALRGMSSAVICRFIGSLTAAQKLKAEPEILELLTSAFPEGCMRTHLFSLYKYSASAKRKEQVSGFLQQFDDEIPGLEKELKNLESR